MGFIFFVWARQDIRVRCHGQQVLLFDRPIMLTVASSKEWSTIKRKQNPQEDDGDSRKLALLARSVRESGCRLSSKTDNGRHT
jgi:hypothetical protein